MKRDWPMHWSGTSILNVVHQRPTPIRTLLLAGALSLALFSPDVIWAQATRGAAGLRALMAPTKTIEVNGRAFDIETDRGLRSLVQWLDISVSEWETARQSFEHQRESKSNTVDRNSAEPTLLRELLSDPAPEVSGRQHRGLREMKRLALEAMAHPDRRAGNVRWLREISAALQNNSRPPAPSRIEMGQPPLVLWDYSHNPVARGEDPAANIPRQPTDRTRADSSSLDPDRSSFWQRPETIAQRDLYHGFGREELPNLATTLWTYSGPKVSYGGSPGFEITDGLRTIKVKFAETRSEPFAARVFWALGYNVDATDYATRLEVKYDRRLLREFNLRKELQTRICALWLVPIYSIDLQKHFDPFESIAEAILTDGTHLTGSELKRRLLVHPELSRATEVADNYRPEVEEQIAYLILAPANIQYRDRNEHSIGPWDFENLGHENLRELRGAGLLSAWLGWVDSRFENTRLKLVHDGPDRVLRHYFTDLGGGLGKSIGILSRCGESPNQFPWTFTRPRLVQGPGRMTVPFRIVGYQPIEDTLAFEQMTWDDARWMARWIGRLSEDQLTSALIASGFDAAQVRLYTEKLISRRDQMIVDLELANEVPLLRPNGANRQIALRADDSVRAKLPSGMEIIANRGSSTLEAGRITAETP